ncbi:MAG: undecaprenyl-diphosphate phosphatase [Spirulinaceae cyanobacterium RM2_2_10]|nr:undecaprenyl-diphosphate phosphatase [Spirulinaceae cyanobacterium SM2_1_0]NJO19095.1 undecaprenyl-diphosphate phosphatase [Spirulinaceae cyanobacterium RM2_2_10]
MTKLLRHLPLLASELLLGTSLAIAFAALNAQAAPVATTTVTGANIDWLQAAVLGMVQGLTEFIPISSTAHLKVVPVALGWGDPGVTFSAAIQLGSIAAVLWYFWGDLVTLARGTAIAIAKRHWQADDLRMSAGIALGTIPIVVIGLAMKAFIPDLDNAPIRSLPAIAIASIVMGILLGLAEKFGRRQRGFEQLSARDGILMGFAQALALIPGVSRSGSTITAGLFMSLDRATAARFSFLLGIPAITLAGLVQLKTDVIDAGVSVAELTPLLVGILSAAVFSYLAIAWLIHFLQTQSTWVFVWYRTLFGLAILAVLSFQQL